MQQPGTSKSAHSNSPNFQYALFITATLCACVPSGAPPGRVAGTVGSSQDKPKLSNGNVLDAGFSSIDASHEQGETPSLTTINIQPQSFSLIAGETVMLQAFGVSSNGQSILLKSGVRWQVNDTSIASISSTGQLQGNSAGVTNVTASYLDLTTQLEFSVRADSTPQLRALAVSPSVVSIGVNNSLQLRITAEYTDGSNRDVTNEAQWTSNDSSIVTVTGSGLVTRIAPGQVLLTVSYDSLISSVTIEDEQCHYPFGTYSVRKGDIIPPIEYSGVSDEAGNTFDFNLRDFYCSSEYENVDYLVFVIGTGWCPYCPAQMREVADQAGAIQNSGGMVVYAEIQDSRRSPASASYARQEVNRIIGNSPGIRVGAAPNELLARAPFVDSYPNGFVVRKRDMRIIAIHGDYSGSIPYSQIAQNLERDWSRGTLNVFSNECGAQDEEASEPNNTPVQAAPLNPGQTSGGICDEQPDFYRITTNGNWRLDLGFSHQTGDLDVYIWDENSQRVLRDANQERIGGSSGTDNESFTGSGSALVFIHGFRYASSPYSLELTELP